jgi:hypothetical protein
MSDVFANRKFSINRNTGVPRPARRFSVGEPGLSGMQNTYKQRERVLAC